jgi:hypothetical protein
MLTLDEFFADRVLSRQLFETLLKMINDIGKGMDTGQISARQGCRAGPFALLPEAGRLTTLEGNRRTCPQALNAPSGTVFLSRRG